MDLLDFLCSTLILGHYYVLFVKSNIQLVTLEMKIPNWDIRIDDKK